MVDNFLNSKCCNEKILLYEPVATYYADVYNTLISVVQGVALGGFIYVLSSFIELIRLDLKITVHANMLMKAIVIFLIISLIWHRYVMHNQYLVWRIGVWDAIIPMLFAVLQISLALSMNSIECFCCWLSLLYFLGFFAYYNVVYHYNANKRTMLNIFKLHFGCKRCSKSEKEKCRLPEILVQEIIKFERLGMRQMLYFAYPFVFLNIFFVFIQPKYLSLQCGEFWKTVIFFPLFLLIGYISFRRDMKYSLNHSDELQDILRKLDFSFKW